MFFEERFSQIELTHTLPNYAKLAEAYGARGFMVDDEDDLVETLADAIDCGETAVVDCRVDPREHCFPMIPAGAAALDLVEYPGEEALAEVSAEDFAAEEGRPGS
jgi:acetolactate synthase-1/2/3 large subunit